MAMISIYQCQHLRDEISAAWTRPRVKSISDDEFARVMETTFPPRSISCSQQEKWLAQPVFRLAEDWRFVSNEFWIQASAGFIAYYLPAMLLALVDDMARGDSGDPLVRARFEGVCSRLEEKKVVLSKVQLDCVSAVQALVQRAFVSE